jgi:hypothetical protein
MLRKWMGVFVTVLAISSLSGCCSFWERHCAPTSYAQPVCCQPCAPACAPAAYQQTGGWTSPAARTAPGCCQ